MKKPLRSAVPIAPRPTVSPPGERWVMLMPNLPGKASSERVKIWRRLQSIGAIAVRPSVYVLPAKEPHLETFQWVSREIVELGGQAALCEGSFVDGVTDDEIRRRFNEVRSADYTALAEASREVAKSLKRKRVERDELAAIEVQIARLRHRLDEVVAIDFCGAPGREGVEGLVDGLARAVESHRGPKHRPGRLARAARPIGATWTTRTGVHVDRIACAWLITRFVDPNARLKFVPAKGYVPEPGELRFDMFEAEFTHIGDRCSFEVILERMGIDDPALHAIAEIVHDIDVRDEKFARPEVDGVRSQITGVCATHREDLARIAAATPLFEALHGFFSLRSKRGDHT